MCYTVQPVCDSVRDSHTPDLLLVCTFQSRRNASWITLHLKIRWQSSLADSCQEYLYNLLCSFEVFTSLSSVRAFYCFLRWSVHLNLDFLPIFYRVYWSKIHYILGTDCVNEKFCVIFLFNNRPDALIMQMYSVVKQQRQDGTSSILPLLGSGHQTCMKPTRA